MAKILADDEFFSKLATAVGATAPAAAEPAPTEPVAATEDVDKAKTTAAPEGSSREDAPAAEEGAAAPVKAKKGLGKLRKAVEEQGTALQQILALFAPANEADGTEAGLVLKALTDLRSDVDAAKTASSAALDAVAKERGRAIKKSLDGQDTEPVTKSADASLDTLMRGLAANAIGRGNRVTLR